ncbi:hypothetical protein Nepgr_028387 [Nepenthes gracilis]|uniref:Uncharacterized protein n=1 Tax=Nepenthes gracilis TaxID=150966 RepID=A0AAD3TC53_NEPGR|nr:hypothetical protein Nepgr_028387 [Nepenthes gracilis]
MLQIRDSPERATKQWATSSGSSSSDDRAIVDLGRSANGPSRRMASILPLSSHSAPKIAGSAEGDKSLVLPTSAVANPEVDV